MQAPYHKSPPRKRLFGETRHLTSNQNLFPDKGIESDDTNSDTTEPGKTSPYEPLQPRHRKPPPSVSRIPVPTPSPIRRRMADRLTRYRDGHHRYHGLMNQPTIQRRADNSDFIHRVTLISPPDEEPEAHFSDSRARLIMYGVILVALSLYIFHYFLNRASWF